MKYLLVLAAFVMTSTVAISQLVINELDCDTPGIDDMEFLELLSDTPNFPLDGFVVVFFNGSENGGNSSYFTVDLDGYVTDVNGLLLIGSNSVKPVPQFLIPQNTIQNGADAVAIYEGSDFNFPDGTLATIDNLIDVLIYDTSDGDDEDMINIFRAHPDFTTIQQINEGPGNNTNSIQRNIDGTYTSTVPTPRKLNDGSGIDLNGIQMAVAQTQYGEGEEFDILFTTEDYVSEDLNFDIGLIDLSFNNADYSGPTSLTIVAGQNSVSTTIKLIDDDLDEGDEVAVIRFLNLSEQFLALNNNVRIRVVDNDFVIAPYGVPTNPTFGIVTSSQPVGYYSNLDAKSGDDLRQALQDIIADPSVVRAQTYSDIVDILYEADQNPANSNQVWLVYSEEGRAKLDFQTTSDNNGKWNREHTFPRSRAGYSSIEEDEVRDGVDIFWVTSADSLRHGNSDAHAIRAADGLENGSRNNQHYGEYIGPVGTLGSFRGDVARSVLYMDIRYNGLEIVNGFPEIEGQMGDLATLLEWHRNDPPDDYEMNRNNVVYEWQRNRNPFIDQPDLVEYIWGEKIGEVWDQTVTTHEIDHSNVYVYPNPTSDMIYIEGLQNRAHVDVYSIHGQKLNSYLMKDKSGISLNLPDGIYMLIITSEGELLTQKVIVSDE
ncbi:MAG: T9SS type A sorting domain-containing protein [Saprospiraceae bacterium]|nr:T9SS type A sorting domain-containing protein [Saprospiraceae bacterium]